MSKLIFTTKTGGSMRLNDIAQAARYFDAEHKGSGQESKIVIPVHMAKNARDIEKALGKKVTVAPIRGDGVYLSNEAGV
jgi:hypothetical protein